jgi:hypothetical protein
VPSRLDITLIVAAVTVVTTLVVFLLPWLFMQVDRYVGQPLRSRGEATVTSDPLPDAEFERLPQEVRLALEAGARRLTSLGFAPAARARSVTDNVLGAAIALTNEQEGASGLVMATRSEVADLPPIHSDHVSLCTEFTDGWAIITVNGGSTVFRPDPDADSVRWRGMRDLDVLYRLHAARVERDGKGRPSTLPAPEAAFDYLVAQELRVLWRQVEAGYLWFDASDRSFRRTLRGALVIYWKLLWPWKQRLEAADERKLRRVLRELGMGSPEEYAPNPKDEAAPALAYGSARG